MANAVSLDKGEQMKVKLNGDTALIEVEPQQLNGNKPETVVITGASAGVGRAVARRFAQAGAQIGLIARGLEGLEGAKADVEKLGGKAIICQADVADAEAVEQAAQKVEDEFGAIDVWINNATTSVFSPVKEMTPEEFRRVTEVTYLGVVYGTQSALKRMLPRENGTIINVGSALAYRAIPLQSAYCAAKHAIQGFTESLRTELIHDKSNITVTMVQLPAVNTPQFSWNKTRLPRKARPVPPIYQPEIMADAIFYAAHATRREVTIGYPAVKAIYGNKIAPGYADWVLGNNGYEMQMTDERVDPNRPHNLWEPVEGDRGAHGAFDDIAYDFSPQAWANTHPKITAAISLGVLAGAAVLWSRLRPQD